MVVGGEDAVYLHIGGRITFRFVYSFGEYFLQDIKVDKWIWCLSLTVSVMSKIFIESLLRIYRVILDSFLNELVLVLGRLKAQYEYDSNIGLINANPT